MGRSFLLVKPEAYIQRPVIANRLKHEGFAVHFECFRKVTLSMAEQLYAEHADQRFYPGLMKQMVNSTVYVFFVESEGNTVADLRALVGATFPSEAKPGTLRRLYGSDPPYNGFHAPDSEAAYEREYEILCREWSLDKIQEHSSDEE